MAIESVVGVFLLLAVVAGATGVLSFRLSLLARRQPDPFERIMFDLYRAGTAVMLGVSFVALAAVLVPEMSRDHRIMALWWICGVGGWAFFCGCRLRYLRGDHPLQPPKS